MANAIFHRADNRFIRRHGHIVKFNGFWRNGDKQNICAWLDKATWHDAKTGEGGGCKDFARVAFNMTLSEFMKEYGPSFSEPTKQFRAEVTSTDGLVSCDVNQLWKSLQERDANRPNHAEKWLTDIRGFYDPHRFISTGFVNLSQDDIGLFAHQHQKFIQDRIQRGRNIVVPLRGIESEAVENLFIRNIQTASKQERTRVLPGCGGWTSKNGTPRAFGFPHLIDQFPNLIMCEGMADYFAAECLLDADENYLPIGAPGTAAIEKWGSWLKEINYAGKIYLIYQLDLDENGTLNTFGPGQMAAVNAKRALGGAKPPAHLFNWSLFLKKIAHWKVAPRDLADSFVCSDAPQEILREAFITTLKETDRKK